MKKKEDILKDIYASKVQNWNKVYEYNPSVIESAHEAMDIYAEQVAIDYENWKKSHGIKWNVDNAHTPAEELFELYKKETP